MRAVKRIFTALLALALLAGAPAWTALAAGPDLTAQLDVAEADPGDGAVTVRMTVKTAQPVKVCAIGFTAVVPDGLVLEAIENGSGSISFAAGDMNLPTGKLNWMDDALNDVQTDEIATLVVTVPKGTPAGEYVIALSDVKALAAYGAQTVVQAQSVSAVLTVAGSPAAPDDPKPAEPGNSAAYPFKDVAAGDWFYDAVLWAVEQSVTTGVSADRFDPDSTCTRAQIVTFLWRAAGSPRAAGANPFEDVASGAWYRDAVLWAVERGITSGVSASRFDPDAPCTRAQAVTFLWRAAGKPEAGGTLSFADVAPGAYFFTAVKWAADSGVTTGVGGGAFGSELPCTRGQIVTFLYRAR